MGFGTYGEMGKMPLNFIEIEAFMRTTKTNLNHWEVTALKQLSLDYIAQSQKKGEYETPPFMEITESEYLKQTSISSNNIARAFGMIMPK